MPTRITDLTLGEISEVDRPAQKDALAAIIKAEDGARAVSIAKRYLDPMDGAVSFAEAFEVEAKRRAYWQAQEKVQPVIGALHTAICSIAGDASLSVETKQERASASALDFLQTLRVLLPEAHGELMEAVEKASNSAGDLVRDGGSMSDNTEQVATLEKKLADMQASLDAEIAKREDAEAVAKMSDEEKAYMSRLDDEKAAAFRKLSADERAKAMKVAKAADETVVIDGETVAKSAVGDQTFAILKAQAARMEAIEKQAKADRDAAELATLEKRASTEFSALPGTPAELAQVLKAVNTLDGDIAKRVESILKAANATAQEAFVTKGHKAGSSIDADSPLEKAAAELRKADPNLTEAQAVAKALDANPSLYEA